MILKNILKQSYKMFIKNNKILLLLVLSISLFITQSKSEVISEFNIIGNERISKSTIILFSELEIESDIDEVDLNNAFKNLYKTNYFKNIKINFEKGILIIDVEENPIIQNIFINGIKNKDILKQLNNITRKFEKSPFIENKIAAQKKAMLLAVQQIGFYFANLEVEVEKLDNNFVNIYYNFETGERAKIRIIKFIGDKKFTNNKLRNIIKSEETKFWKFITRNKYLNPQRIALDRKLLEEYYKNKGYYNVSVKATSAKVINKNGFELIYNIDSGKKYFFNKLNFNFDNDTDESFISIKKQLSKLESKTYSEKKLKSIIEEIDKISLLKNFVFINSKYEEKIVKDNLINVEIFLEENNNKFFVDRINILGNIFTEEKVLRNQLIIDEGDPFNEILFKRSVNNIKGLNIFKSVNTKILDSNTADKKNINISVEEKPTGEITTGAGTGTMGTTVSAGIKESNYLGKGVSLSANVTVSSEEVKGLISYRDPNFNNTNRVFKSSLESSTTDNLTVAGYKTEKTGFSIGTNFEQYSDINVDLNISSYFENLETSKAASDIKKKQAGDYFENVLTYGLIMNKLDQNFQPTDGYKISFFQSLPIYSDDWAVENTLSASNYIPVTDRLIISSKFFLKAVHSLDGNVRASKRAYLSSRRLKGFKAKSIGPKEGGEYIGGNYASAINLNTTLPNLINEYENIDVSLFLDAANIWHVDYNNSLDDNNKIRASTGISVNWFTPVGPLTFSYAIPISKKSTDETESFRFQIGTSF